ncbi:hypothetical protein [Conexibacter woesei]|uniref:hypothetical protein n=1 Tax=Conexibacter woesei TaxID=191495 RepID=UPI0011D2AC38|nr:hypothetical protein [Conexibacter woesei]
MINRCAREEGVAVTLNVPTAKFGIPRLRSELAAFQSVLKRSGGAPDILVIMIDANAEGVASRRRQIDAVLDRDVIPVSVCGVPDPYVERWLLADPVSFAETFGHEPEGGRVRTRKEWKARLVKALERGGQIVTQGGAEFAEEIVSAMDLYRAGRIAPSLNAFISDLRTTLRTLGV